jgi:hypothetical protein
VRFDVKTTAANASQYLNSRNAASSGAETARISGEDGDIGMGRKGTFQREFSVGTGVGTLIPDRMSANQIKHLAGDVDVSLSANNIFNYQYITRLSAEFLVISETREVP